MKKFDDTGAWNLPVVDNGKYVGFVSKSKIFNSYRRVLRHYCEDWNHSTVRLSSAVLCRRLRVLQQK